MLDSLGFSSLWEGPLIEAHRLCWIPAGWYCVLRKGPLHSPSSLVPVCPTEKETGSEGGANNVAAALPKKLRP